MKFQPKTERELQEANLWPVGEYAFEVLTAEEAVDKNDAPFFKLKVKIFNDEGKSTNVFENVSPNWMEYKLRHLAEAAGLLVEYERGEIEAYQLEGKTGRCKVNISKDKGDGYAVKNQITDYIVKGASNTNAPKAKVDDSDIPF